MSLRSRKMLSGAGCAGVLGLSMAGVALGGRFSVHVPGDVHCESCSRAQRAGLALKMSTRPGLRLFPRGEVGEGGFGYKVALSSDGNSALVGGALDDNGRGAAWVFQRTATGWVQQGPKLVGGGEVGEAGFGGALALSADGKTALIGAPGDDHRAGAAWVFVLRGSRWVQQGPKLTAADEAGRSELGYAVALSADGSTALVGGPTDARPKGISYNTGRGAAWVFRRTGGRWHQLGRKLTGRGENPTGLFGGVVCLSANGNTALIAAPNANPDRGAVWAFTRTPAGWRQQGNALRGGGERGDLGQFGTAIALSGNGKLALISAPGDRSNIGAVWYFACVGGVWKQQGTKFTARGETGRAGFGVSLALSRGGDAALIGGWEDNHGWGAVWVFERRGRRWLQIGPKHPPPIRHGANGRYGISVAVSADARTALVGGVLEDHRLGAAWIFGR